MDAYVAALQARIEELREFVGLSEHKLDQRLQGQYTNEQILGMLLAEARRLLLKHGEEAKEEKL